MITAQSFSSGSVLRSAGQCFSLLFNAFPKVFNAFYCAAIPQQERPRFLEVIVAEAIETRIRSFTENTEDIVKKTAVRILLNMTSLLSCGESMWLSKFLNMRITKADNRALAEKESADSIGPVFLTFITYALVSLANSLCLPALLAIWAGLMSQPGSPCKLSGPAQLTFGLLGAQLVGKSDQQNVDEKEI